MADIIRTDKSEDFGFTEPNAATGVPIVQGRAAMMIGHNNTWQEFAASNPKLIEDDKVGLLRDHRQASRAVPGRHRWPPLRPGPSSPTPPRRWLSSWPAPSPRWPPASSAGNVPAVTSVADSEYVKDNKAVQFAMDNLDAAFSEGGVPHWLDIRGDFKATIESALLGQTSAQQALDALAAKADDKL